MENESTRVACRKLARQTNARRALVRGQLSVGHLSSSFKNGHLVAGQFPVYNACSLNIYASFLNSSGGFRWGALGAIAPIQKQNFRFLPAENVQQ